MLKTEKFNPYIHGQKHARAAQSLDAYEADEVDLHLEKEVKEPDKNDLFEKVKVGYIKRLEKLMPKRKKEKTGHELEP